MDGWMDGWMDGRMDAWMDARMHESSSKLSCMPTLIVMESSVCHEEQVYKYNISIYLIVIYLVIFSTTLDLSRWPLITLVSFFLKNGTSIYVNI